MTYCDERTVDSDHEWFGLATAPDVVTREQVWISYEALASARTAAYDAAQAAIDAKEALEFDRSQLLLSGAIQGKNEAERDAKARELLADQIRVVRRASRLEALTRYELDLAAQEVEKVRLLVRLDEMEAYAANGVRHER